MEINLIKINGFGKIKNKEIKLNKNINIIYGKNEQGKTTTLKFLNSIFFGASKNKNGKEISDFEKYKPWDNSEYSGKIIYTLNSGEQYEVYREFNKKNPKILNSKLEDISKNFNIDKNRGNEFFLEQTGVDEDTFNSSTLIEQKEVFLDQADRRNIIQKISNLLNTGEENISYKKIIDKLNKKYNEEVGTDRTTDRPINKINDELNNINLRINNIKLEENKKEEINIKKEEINKEIKNIENRKIILNKIKEIKNKIKNKTDEINIKNNLITENKNKINIIENNFENNKKENKKNNKKIFVLIFIILILELITLFLKINLKIKIIISILLFIFLIINLFIFLKNNKIKNKENNKLNDEKNASINIIGNLQDNIIKLNKEKELEEEKEKNNIIEEYNSLINKNEIVNIFNNNIDNIENDIKKIEEENNNLKFEKYQIEITEKNINNNIEQKIKLEEQLENIEEQKKELLFNGQSIELAKQFLEIAYNKMKNNITPQFKNNILKNKSGIIGEKYKNIVFNEEGINVELENGNYIDANLLSVGTIDQLYLALRLAVMQEISKEDMPIILDETFAYYDDERLENILNYLNNNFNKNQIIIFTCSNREKEILDKLKITYNFIEL